LLASPALGYQTYSVIRQPCFPNIVSLFGSLSCSIEGPSYISSETPQPFQKTERTYIRTTNNSSHSNFRPWSHEPICTEELEGIGDVLCVFTSTDFQNGRGISIITIPRIAEQISILPVFSPSASNSGLNTSSSRRVSQLPGKGRAILASSEIQQGEPIAADAPVVLFREGLAGMLSLQEYEELMRVAVSRLPAITQKSLSNLSARRFTARAGGSSVFLMGVLVNHAGLSISIGGVPHAGIFHEFGLINHSCAPKSV